ncbi:MAG TPA: bifunctional UDP-N-acetylglucosamine diphosphorylase/glucosamine-1-phosphate N-acetyltransferase GlmU [Polyangiaceae bacterium]|nr:bifunctional UDP-N-acetylglucosamine diphosphorylase/glucosamine-1-phosphate N-acetyltransferase GlmU [Polyangiaceae bacterium]
MNDVTAVVLAAGMGTRMKSKLPKVLHRAAGRPLVEYAVRAALELGVASIVVVTSGHAEIDAHLARAFGAKVRTVVQDPPRGTGDAARVGLAAVQTERALIYYGDAPLLTTRELEAVVAASREVDLAFASAIPGDPHGYGRVLRDASGRVLEIREQKDLRSDAERGVREVNAGIYAAKKSVLERAVAELQPMNAQGELYLTDVVASVAASGRVSALVGSPDALVGVNDRAQLREAEELLYARTRERLGREGVMVHGDARIDDGVSVAAGAEIEAGVRLRGATSVGADTHIDVGCVLTDATVGARVELKPYSVVTSSRVGDAAQIGPFAHLRPESEIEAEVHVGNFVETKKTRMRRGSKANHLSYLGDGDVGERANVGAGTIFCNYDGFQKHETIIGEGAFIGSDSQLVAPVTVGKGAFVASGTTVTADVPDDALALARTRQENKPGYADKLRARLGEAARQAKLAKK